MWNITVTVIEGDRERNVSCLYVGKKERKICFSMSFSIFSFIFLWVYSNFPSPSPDFLIFNITNCQIKFLLTFKPLRKTKTRKKKGKKKKHQTPQENYTYTHTLKTREIKGIDSGCVIFSLHVVVIRTLLVNIYLLPHHPWYWSWPHLVNETFNVCDASEDVKCACTLGLTLLHIWHHHEKNTSQIAACQEGWYMHRANQTHSLEPSPTKNQLKPGQPTNAWVRDRCSLLYTIEML